MSEQATSLGYALLGLLHQEEQTGYALQQFFEDSPMGIYSSSPGAIYPALKRLEKKGLVISNIEETGPVKRVRLYCPTRDGTKALREWLTQPITRRVVETGMDELMLRFAFLGLVDDAQATRAFLDDLAGQLESYLDQLAEVYEQLEAAGTGPHGRLALEGGIETYRAHLAWARRAQREFTEERLRAGASEQVTPCPVDHVSLGRK